MFVFLSVQTNYGSEREEMLRQLELTFNTLKGMIAFYKSNSLNKIHINQLQSDRDFCEQLEDKFERIRHVLLPTERKSYERTTKKIVRLADDVIVKMYSAEEYYTRNWDEYYKRLLAVRKSCRKMQRIANSYKCPKP